MIAIHPAFEQTLHKLEKLSRNHLLFFRLEVGRLILDEFYAGDAVAYQLNDRTKPQRFQEFADACAEQLADIGLGEQVLRQCVVAHVVVRTLPVATVAQLGFSQVVELTRVPDPATRSLLAQATVENGWTARQLRGAAEAAKAGLWIDGDLSQPGLQPPDVRDVPPESAKVLPLGRVVSRFERTVADFDELVGHWQAAAGEKLSKVQRERVRKALAELEARLAEVKAGLRR